MKKSTIKFTSLILATLMLSLSTFGCTASNIMSRGDVVNKEKITTQQTRRSVLATYGQPVESTRAEDGTRIDIFKVPQGEAAVSKGLKTFVSLIVSIGTLGLAEIITYPMSSMTKSVSFEVQYDEKDYVRSVIIIKGSTHIL